MAKIILTFNGDKISEHELDREEVTIGRKPDNDIQIDNLAVSGKHARVLTILNDSFLEDLGSTNGTYVNGSLVKKHALKDGDRIAIGKHELEYVNEAASEDQFDQTMIIRPDATGMAEESSSDTSIQRSVGKIEAEIAAESASGAPVAKARLRVVSGANKGKELELNKALTTLGKPGVQVAAITRRSKGYFLIHVEGDENNRPTVNGEPVGKQAHKLEDAAVLEVAGVRMEFILE